jgi:outer membrane receptor for ferrienterochelin and colicins
MRNLLLLIMFLSTIGIFAQGRIEGTATNDKGEPISFGNVVLKKDGKLITGASTDFDGFYFIDNIKAGDYEITVSHSGVESPAKIVTINESVLTACDFSYELVNNIPEVVVTVTTSFFNPEEPHIVEIKGATFIETGKKDVTKIVSTGAGTTKDKDGNISFRGSRPGAANYYIDGLSVQGNIGIPTSSIYSMKVHNGGIPAKFGNTTGAIIEVRTKSYFDYFE